LAQNQLKFIIHAIFMWGFNCGITEKAGRGFPNSKWSKIKKNFDYLGVFIGVLLVLANKTCSLPAKLWKRAKNWRYPVCTKLSKMTQDC